MTLLIAAEHISVFRRSDIILNDVSLTVGARDFITIIGPNGAGKSMLLKCMIGLVKPDKGKIERKSQLKLGYVPQKLISDPTIPILVKDFLALRKNSTESAILNIAEEIGIHTILKKPLYVLSGGELQRVVLARALLNSPELLVLDEPAQNLDIAGQLAFYKLLEHIYKERSISILMVSHDLHMVMSSTQKVICLFHHICCSGEPQLITKDPEFIALFGSDMARMMSIYHHSHNHEHHEGHEHYHG